MFYEEDIVNGGEDSGYDDGDNNNPTEDRIANSDSGIVDNRDTANEGGAASY
jgi:hypothetical protein